MQTQVPLPPAVGKFVKSTIPQNQKALPPVESHVTTGRRTTRPVQVPVEDTRPKPKSSTNVVFTNSIMDLPNYLTKWQSMTNDELNKVMGPAWKGGNRVKMITHLATQYMDSCRLTSLPT